MAKAYKIYIWKKAPMLRLVLPLIAGIILELQFKFGSGTIILFASVLLSAYFVFSLLPLAYYFRFQPTGGIMITAFTIAVGSFLTWQKDIRNHAAWYGNFYDSSSYIIATIIEPPVEKNKSYKALAEVDGIIKEDSVSLTKGKVLLYFSKDSASDTLAYGSRVIIKKQLQELKNSGNPAAFDYKRYCAARQIFHECYVKKNEWLLLKGNVSTLKSLVFKTQRFVINVLNKYITGADESALAKALLIGYKVDLDKDLVQAYSNAGVIHLIVIAGLHLGLIYVLLFRVTSIIPLIKSHKVLRFVLILSFLWFFAFLTGASPPVLRAVVMFSFITAGKAFSKKASVFNSLALSAFILLCYDPFILEDAGFQLSYLAVTSIVISQRYIYNWFYIRNKLLREIWELASVSLSAQILTLPACLYYFHQVPLLFMLSNIVAIPLAAFALWGCLILVFVSPVHVLALYLGKLITAAIWLLNHTVLFINSLPFSLWSGFSISAAEAILLYVIFSSFLYWLIRKNRTAFALAVSCVLILILETGIKKWNSFKQKKIIVYNIPAHTAIDFISGNRYNFIGDSGIATDNLLQNFNLKPSRINFRVYGNKEDNAAFFRDKNFCQFYDKRVLLVDSGIIYKPLAEKIHVDYIIISKSPKIVICTLAEVFNCPMYIFDASNSLWKIAQWKKDCEQLHLRYHSVPEQGAFVTDL